MSLIFPPCQRTACCVPSEVVDRPVTTPLLLTKVAWLNFPPGSVPRPICVRFRSLRPCNGARRPRLNHVEWY
jgi:hypothetical protein